MDSTLFIYRKNDEIKALDVFENPYFNKDGWEHIATLNSATFVKYLLELKTDKDILKAVKNLKQKL